MRVHGAVRIDKRYPPSVTKHCILDTVVTSKPGRRDGDFISTSPLPCQDKYIDAQDCDIRHTQQSPTMFCTNLRRRASFASVLPLLISTEGLKLRGWCISTIPLSSSMLISHRKQTGNS
jgi:hypothetical protein